MVSETRFRFTNALLWVIVLLLVPSRAWAAAEVKLDRDYLAGLVEKAPSVPFQKEGRYRGTLQSFRFLGIDAKSRRFLLACQVAGEFRPPLARRAEKDAQGVESTEHWRNFRFDLQVGIHIEPGGDGAPRFRVEIEEVKRHELEGFAGLLAKVLGKSFDDIVKQVADGKTARLNDRLNSEMLKRINTFREYGIFYAIDYAPTHVVLHFDVSRYRSEGVAGYVYPDPQPGTAPFYRWVNRKRAEHVYTLNPNGPDRRIYKPEKVACFVFAAPQPETVALYRWRSRFDRFYTTAPDGEGAGRKGYRPEGIACYVYTTEKPGTVPLYRFAEPHTGLHFYTTHPHAEFAK